MSVINHLSLGIAKWVKANNNDETSSLERLTALISIKLNNYSIIVCSILVGFLTGKPLEATLSLLGFIAVRQMTGGVHFNNLDACFVFSTILFSFVPHIEFSSNISKILTLISFVLVVIFSKKKKLVPGVLILLNLVGQFPFLALSFIVQGITLILEGRGERNEKANRSQHLETREVE